MFLGIDAGTSAIKGVLLSATGRLVARAVEPVVLMRPSPERAEIDPEAHYRSVCRLILSLAGETGDPSSIRAVSLAAASGNTLLMDASGKPLGNIISWLDERCLGHSDTILPGFDFSSIHPTVGWPWTESFPLAHLAWLRINESRAYEKAHHYGMNNDYLHFRLTGSYALDPSTATTLYLQDQAERRWHRPYLERLAIPEEALSPILPTGEPVARIAEEAAGDTGLCSSTLLATGAFDHPSAARGTGVLKPGNVLFSCGTSWVGFYPLSHRDLALEQELLVDPFLSSAGPWAGMFSLTKIGLRLDWEITHLLHRRFNGSRETFRYFNSCAQGAYPGAGGLFIDPMRDLTDRPDVVEEWQNTYEDSQISRAIMEGAAFEMRRKIAGLEQAGLPAERITMTGGPSESPIWPQIIADTTGLEVTIVAGQSAGAVGAALMAAVGSGFFKDEEEAFQAMGQKPVRRLSPQNGGTYSGLYEEYVNRYPQNAEHEHDQTGAT
jgi:sugar (pentulose or hexulose) kinase